MTMVNPEFMLGMMIEINQARALIKRGGDTSLKPVEKNWWAARPVVQPPPVDVEAEDAAPAATTDGSTTTFAGQDGELADPGHRGVQIPGGHALFRDGEDVYLGYVNEAMPVGAQFLWHISSPEELETFFPQGHPEFIEVDLDEETKTLSPKDGEGDPVAFLVGGPATELSNTADDPTAGVLEKWKLQAARDPELWGDPEFGLLMLESINQTIDPETFQLRLRDIGPFQGMSPAEIENRMAIGQMLPDELRDAHNREYEVVNQILEANAITTSSETRPIIEYLAGGLIRGEFTLDDIDLQARVLAGVSPDDMMDNGLRSLMNTSGIEVTSQAVSVEALRDELTKYIGPFAASSVSDEYLQDWAKRLQEDPNEKAAWIKEIQDQRVHHFGSYGNDRTVRYETISGPYKTLVQQIWGEKADEEDPFFHSLVQGNDLNEAAKQLRKRGIAEGKANVMQDIQRAFGRTAMGQQVAPTLL